MGCSLSVQVAGAAGRYAAPDRLVRRQRARLFRRILGPHMEASIGHRRRTHPIGSDLPYGITYASRMTAISATTARANLYHLIDQVNEESEPLTITGQRGNAVLIGESDWRAIQETLFLESVPGFTESIRQVRAAGVQEGSTELDW
jgi:antitoxin YefM